ncbi:nucleotidyltransferase domain-containing protein [Microcoleus sp. D2_18a_B4]|uniref:nucleotidyltransferase domain-containing protein n=1 Tax=Microcoleus sp. D2_18a_B4 TaxID=3055329 RepID=UPI002FD221E1
MNTIMELSRAIANKFQPQKIILFGSYAYGNPTEDSDVDMLVVLSSDGNNIRKTWEILNQTQPNFAVDLLVRTPSEIEQRLAWNDLFLREIIEKGKVIYESAHT